MMIIQQRLALMILSCAVVLAATGTLIGQGSGSTAASFGKLPLYFVENRGVYPAEVDYYIQGADKTLFFTKGGVTFSLRGEKRGWTVKLDFVDANKVQPEGMEKQQAVFSYFKGPEKDWKAGLRTYARIVYRDLWPGIDLVYNGTVNKLKYEFVVAPGADPAKIRLRYRGADKLTITEHGALCVTTPEGSFEDAPPAAWQEIDGKRVPVTMAYALAEDGEFFFELGDYDRNCPLVLDPAVLVYCGYIGGAGAEGGNSIAVDAAGNAYVTGTTWSDQQTFPVRVGPGLTFNGSTYDAFVAKVNVQGTGLVYCGYIGGAGGERGYGIVVDAAGNAYVTGRTRSDSATFPVMVGPDLSQNGNKDGFIAKVNAQGTGLVYCGYIGGASWDEGRSIAVDAAGNAYVTGHTGSDQLTFPVWVGPDLIYNGSTDAFVAKVNPQGTQFDYCGYIGGVAGDEGYGIAVDANGNAYVAGIVSSDQNSFPVKVGPDLTSNGGWDAFVAKVNAQGTGLVYCGFIGGAGGEDGPIHSSGIEVDGSGNAYVMGITSSGQQTFPVTIGPDLTYNGGNWDVFVAKVNPPGTQLVYCGYIGGAADDEGHGIAVDASGNAYVTGVTPSDQNSFPVKVGPDLTFNGSTDAFVAKVNPHGTQFVYCGYIGGAGGDRGHGIAVDAAGNAYVMGYTDSDQQTFPVTVGPDLTHNGGRTDAFVAKVALMLLQGSGGSGPGTTVTLLRSRSLPWAIGLS